MHFMKNFAISSMQKSSSSKALPKMAKASSSEELKKAFEDHLAETENQVKRLEDVFQDARQAGSSKKMRSHGRIDYGGRINAG